MGKSKSCGVCGQRRCVQSTKCVEYRTKGTIDGRATLIYVHGVLK